MDLASHQRTMLGLIRASYRVSDDDEAYVQRIAKSADLQEARGNIHLWRIYVLERTCVLTVALLRQRQRLACDVERFIRRHNVSPFRESQPLDFLASLQDDTDALVAAVAQFELALSNVRAGAAGVHVIRWPTNPGPVLQCLAEERPLADRLIARAYVTRVARGLPHLFTIERTPIEPALAEKDPTLSLLVI